MWTREKSKEHIKNTCGEGWLKLVDTVYDAPSEVSISLAYQKSEALHFDVSVPNERFKYFLESVEERSLMVCEVCGLSVCEKIIDNRVCIGCEVHS